MKVPSLCFRRAVNTQNLNSTLGSGWIAILATLCFSAALIAKAGPDRPNIVFIFSDDHAVQAISAYNNRINRTPNMDRLADEGVVFVNSFCANSICGPSRACILTGKHSHINGFRRNGQRFDPTQTTFPKLLQTAGYETAVIGKWHLGTDPVGFDYWEVLPGQGAYYNPDFKQMDGSRKRYTGYCTDIITDRSLQWLKERKESGQPFMLMTQHKAPHRNWSPAPRHLSMYQDEKIPEPETLFDDYSGRTRLLKENEMSIADHFHWGHDMKFHGENLFPEHFRGRHGNREYERMTPEQKRAWDAHYEPENQAFIEKMKAGELSSREITQWKYQRYIKDYLRCIAAVDENIGRLLDYLDASGLAENTVVIYSSDQGFYLGEHGWYDKRWMFEESLQMPFIVRWPGVAPAGVKAPALIQNIDYAPTFLDIAGAPIPEAMQGRSLLPILRNGGRTPADWRDAIYYAYYENAAVHNVPLHDGVRNDRYKLMFFPRTRQWQLFDLARDPLELQSVHNRPEYADVLQGVRRRYEDLKDYYDVNTAAIPATRGTEDWWRDRLREKNRQAREGRAELAFIGDSITQGWESNGRGVWTEFYEDRRAINLGFSGDRTEHVLWRLNHGNLDGIRPKAAVLLIGTNNTGHLMQDPQEIAAGVQRILNLLKEKRPETRVLLLGVFPRGQFPHDEKRLNNVAVNQIIQNYADGERVHYLDIGERFLNVDGTLPQSIMPDGLHLNSKGYRIWAEAIEPKLREWGL